MSFLDAREHGAKPGSGGVASAQQEGIDRRERLRRLALETIDLAKDPYYMRNHLGQIECRLCLTLHSNEGNYLAHTQGKRHQQNLAKRAAREAADKPMLPVAQKRVQPKKTVKIGRPGYRVTKQFNPETCQRSLLFQVHPTGSDIGLGNLRLSTIKLHHSGFLSSPLSWARSNDDSMGEDGYSIVDVFGRHSNEYCFGFSCPAKKDVIESRIEYPEIEEEFIPRHRFMSSFEQKIEAADKNYQYLLFAAEPYEVIAFKIPNVDIDRAENKFFTYWDPDSKIFSLQLHFKHENAMRMGVPPPPPGQMMPPPLPPMPGMFRPQAPMSQRHL